MTKDYALNRNYEALITSAETNTALAVTRSLGEKGINITCASSTRLAKSFYSKYCKNRLIYPSPEKQPEHFSKFLLNEVRKNHYDALFLTTDLDMYCISKNREEFLPYVKIPNDFPTFMKVLDKSQTIKVALALNIPVPGTVFVDNINQLGEISEALEYPVIIKPRQSAALIFNQIVGGGTAYVNSKKEFIPKYKKLHQKIPYPLIQEYIPGEEKGVFVLLHDGELKAIFGHKRFRTVNPLGGGGSALCESADIDPRIEEYTLRILREIKWEGAAMAEFKIDSRDNIPKLLEINGRLWASLRLAIASGVNFPYLLFKIMMNEDIEPVLTYKKGVKYRYLTGDFSHLIRVMIGTPAHAFEHPKRLPTLLSFMQFHRKNIVYGDISVNDPRVLIGTFYEFFSRLPFVVGSSVAKRLHIR